jgi:ParB family chromosome partitioning protein
MSVAHSVPRGVIEAIGPAPKAGRPRWIALAERLAQTKKASTLETLLESREFKGADTDSRFGQVMAFLSAQRAKKKPEAINNGQGVKLALVERAGAKINLVFDDSAVPAFADYVAAKLEQLHQSYLADRQAEQG